MPCGYPAASGTAITKIAVRGYEPEALPRSSSEDVGKCAEIGRLDRTVVRPAEVARVIASYWVYRDFGYGDIGGHKP